MMRRAGTMPAALLAALCGCLIAGAARADALPFLPPGDDRLRHLLELEADEGNLPLVTTWPLPTADLPEDMRSTLYSLQQVGTSADAGWFVSGASNPTQLRTFDDTPRAKGEAGLQAGWAAGDYAGGVIKASYAYEPQDGMHIRFDDSYASWRFGNWWVTLGQQQRWWGPGWDGSLILSNNARPMPSLALDRASSAPFETWLLHWLGPWRFTTYLARDANHGPEYPRPMLWAARATAKPLKDIEISLSRTAQWCRRDFCGVKAFENVLLDKDYTGYNVSAAQQPGKQKLSWDVRWHLRAWPAAVYWQINGESADQSTPLLPRPRQTTDLIGLDFWGHARGEGGWRGFIEWAGTTCGQLSTASSDKLNYNCAYYGNVNVPWGYYYRGLNIGDSIQGDSEMWTLGGIYLDANERTWELRLRKGILNRDSVSVLNTLTPVAAGVWDIDAKVDGHLQGFVISLGVGAERLSPEGEARVVSGRVYLTVSRPW